MSSTAEEKTHFVGVLKIEKVTKPAPNRSATQNNDRDVSEVTHLTIKAPSLESLKIKLAGHIELVDED